MKYRRLIAAVALVLSVAVVAAPALAQVPDARLVVSDVSVSPSDPDPGNTTTVEFTVENSAGSTTGVNLSRVALEERGDDTVHAEAEGVGALSVGDSVTLELSSAFTDAGVRDLALVVEATDENGETVVVTRPVTIGVGGVGAAGITDDVAVDARVVAPAELEEDEQVNVDLGAGGVLQNGGGDDDEDQQPREPVVEIEVTNFGTATARDVVVEPSAGNGSLPRLAVADVAAGESESVYFDATGVSEPTTFEFRVGYTLGTERSESETTLAYRPNRGKIALTDVDMTISEGRLSVTGNAANEGLGEVYGATVSVGSAEGVSPAYPAQDFFLGTVPASEFVRFDLTAEVDNATATVVPVTVTYLADGEPYERTFELEYEPRDVSEAEGDGSNTSLTVVGVTGSLMLGGVAAFGWRRWYRGGD